MKNWRPRELRNVVSMHGENKNSCLDVIGVTPSSSDGWKLEA